MKITNIQPVVSGGGGTPGGSPGQVQYNLAGAFAGSSQMTFNGSTVSFAPSAAFTVGAGTSVSIADGAASSLAMDGIGGVTITAGATQAAAFTTSGVSLIGPTTITGATTASLVLAKSSASVSATNFGALRFNTATNHFEISENGGAYAQVATGGSLPVGANPSQKITGATAVNGSALTFMRSDAAPGLGVGSVDVSTTVVTGTLAAGRMPAFTGDVTNAAGSLAMTIAAGAVGASNLATGAVDVSTTVVTGTLAAGRMPALTGVVTTTAGSLTTAIANGAITNAMLANGAVANLSGTNTGDQTLPTGANPSAAIGLTAVNGSATTFLRSDGASAIDQSIAPTWTGIHQYNTGPFLNSNMKISWTNGGFYCDNDAVNAIRFMRQNATTVVLSIDTIDTRVGINTTAPGAELDVYGNIQTSSVTGKIKCDAGFDRVTAGVLLIAQTAGTATSVAVQKPLSCTGTFASTGIYTATANINPAVTNTPSVGTSALLFKQVWGQQFGGKLQTVSSSGAITIDPTAGEICKLTASGNVTGLTLTVGVARQMMDLVLIQNAGGTATWPTTITNVKLVGGTFTKSPGANAEDTLSLVCDGTVWHEKGRSLNLS